MEGENRASEKPSIFKNLGTSTFDFLSKSYIFFCSFLSNQNPLLSIFVAFYTLILLYLPHLFLSLFFSPVLIFTVILLVSLLHLGASQNTQLEKDEIFEPEIEKADSEDEDPIWVGPETATETNTDSISVQKPHFSESFVEWSRKGPLEVIYEEYEGEEEDSPENDRRMVSLSFYYTDSDSSEGEFPSGFQAWDSPESLSFRWEDDREEGLIEIPLGGKGTVGFHVEEENLIEIDLSVAGK
ncbi:uncharacterized protein LOC131236654 [Magnolia sinica]|uniref:uncharacterized protein LOC131236654 n=1 Tax=Magnolia sinica TaxID=86752 RepID=UPI00265ABB1F|nr:uncharacterized protein LOC131236654 [Magnolia sinica]